MPVGQHRSWPVGHAAARTGRRSSRAGTQGVVPHPSRARAPNIACPLIPPDKLSSLRDRYNRNHPVPFRVEVTVMVFNTLFRFFMGVQIALFRMTKGRAMSAMRGMPVLLLTTVGRKTGKRRTTPLMYIRDGERYVITASNSGRDKHPAWLHNLQASPNVQIEIPGKRLEVSVSVATQSEREWLWPQLVAQAPFFDGYQKGTTRTIPMVMLKSR